MARRVGARRLGLPRVDSAAMRLRLKTYTAYSIGCAVVLLVTCVSAGAAPTPHDLIAFVSTRDATNAVYTVAPDGSGLRRVATGAESPQWSPDGGRLAFLRHEDVWVLDLATGRQHVVARGLCGDPRWSPDGRRIAYSQSAGRQGIWVVDADGRNPAAISTGWDNFPAWSPDGKELLFTRDAETILAVSVDGGAPRKLGDAIHGAPLWSPDGKGFAFTREVAFAGESVFVGSVAGGKPKRLLRQSGYALDYAWSPDGRLLAVTNLDGMSLAVFTRAGVLRKVLVRYGDVQGPAWSPSGDEFVAAVGGDLWRFPLGGGKARQITHASAHSYEDSYPVWQKVVSTPPGELVGAGIETDSRLHGNVLSTRARVARLAADGDRVALAYAARPHCLELWDVSKRKLVRIAENACAYAELGTEAQLIVGIALAGRRVAWEVVEETNSDTEWVAQATEDRPEITTLYSAEQDLETLGGIAGSGSTLAFDSLKDGVRLLHVAGRKPRPLPGLNGAPLLAARDGLLVWRAGPTSLQVLRRDGSLLRAIATGAPVEAAAVDSGELASFGGQVLEVRSLRSGKLEERVPVPAAARFAGYAGGLAALLEPRAIVVVRPGDSARAVFHLKRNASGAVLTSAGLFYAETVGGHYRGRVTYVPRRQLLARIAH